MKKSYFLTIPCLCLLFAGCAREPDDPPPPVEETRLELSPEALAVLDIYASDRFDVTEEEAADKARQAMQTFFGDSPTRSGGGPLTVKSIRGLASEKVAATLARTRAAGDAADADLPENICYAVNFSDGATDSAGFVLVAADKRIRQDLLAVVPAGSFPAPGDEVDHDGLAFFLENLEEYAAWSIAESERKADSLKQAMIADLQALYPDEKIEVIFREPATRINGPVTDPFRIDRTFIPLSDPWLEKRVDPLIPVEWHQYAPYNDLVKDKAACGNAVAGCVPLATAQLMAYWKQPAVVGNLVMNWDLVRSYTSDQSWRRWENKPYNKWLGPTSWDPLAKYQTAYLLKHIGESIGASYNCGTPGCPHCDGDGTSAANGDARTYLDRFGYKTCNSADYDFEKVVTALQAGKPIFMDGKSEKKELNILGITFPIYKGGHAWLLDGCRVIKQTFRYFITTWRGGNIVNSYSYDATTSYSLIHNNWGWAADINGYYYTGVFNMNQRSRHSDGTSSNPTKLDYPHEEYDNYRYKIRLWYNIYY